MKSKKISALIIGTCIAVNSMVGVYAGTTSPDTPVSVQIEQVKADDELLQKQKEIDQYVFEQNKKDLDDRGISVAYTGVIDNYVEVGIIPYSEKNADYIYELFGKDQVKVVEGIMATTMISGNDNPEVVMQFEQADQEKPSILSSFFSSIWNWIKSIF